MYLQKVLFVKFLKNIWFTIAQTGGFGVFSVKYQILALKKAPKIKKFTIPLIFGILFL